MRTFYALLLCAAALVAADAPRRAPGFSLVDINGTMHDLADYRGKVVILEFMQSTCPHCATFAAVLQKVEQRYGARVQVLAVGNPPADTPASLQQYVAGHKISYPVMLDCGQMAYSYVLRGNIDLPAVYLIDGAGMIRAEYFYNPLTHGMFEGDAIFGEIDRLLAPAVPASAAPRKKK